MKDSTARACLPGVLYNSYGWPRASLGVRQVGGSPKTVKMGGSRIPEECWGLAILREGRML